MSSITNHFKKGVVIGTEEAADSVSRRVGMMQGSENPDTAIAIAIDACID